MVPLKKVVSEPKRVVRRLKEVVTKLKVVTVQSSPFTRSQRANRLSINGIR